MTNYSFFGAGVMGETLLSGLLASGIPGTDVLIVEKRAERAAEIEAQYGVGSADAIPAAQVADVAILVVKPQDTVALLEQIGSHFRPGTLVISIAAGITTATVEGQVAEGVDCVRAMPNTPALLGQGMTGVSGGAHCSGAAVHRAADIMSTVGSVVLIPESQQDALTAISGSGPAYVFYLAEALLEGAAGLGLDPALARTLVNQTLLGASAMLGASQDDPAELRRRVTSPNGTTAAACAVLDDRAVGESFVRAVAAAAKRSQELSAG